MLPTPFEIELPTPGKVYKLRYPWSAIIDLENRLNKGFSAIVVEMQDPASVRVGMLRELLFTGLKTNHPEITLEEAGELIGPAGGLAVAMNKVAEAIAVAFQVDGGAAPAGDGTKSPTSRPRARTGSSR